MGWLDPDELRQVLPAETVGLSVADSDPVSVERRIHAGATDREAT